MSETTKPVIFISYSHDDRKWLDYVRSFFEPLAEHWNLQIWDDEKLRIGDNWRGDIHSALDASRIFILLVSRYALSSAFIRNEEVGRILRRPAGEVQFCPIVVTPYYTRPLPWLDQPNRRPKDGKALSQLQDAERDLEMVAIAEQIDEIVVSIYAKSAGAAAHSLPPIIPLTRPAFPSIVDYGRLPEAPYKTLVGRDVELQQLDDAWADEKTRIISLVARGGAGKTSLVIEWLTRVRNDGYRNANAVLCWSFYSQGTTERAASGEGFLDWALAKLKIKLDTTSSTAKGERLAEEMSRRRVLLVLDGVEPLQYGPEGQLGALKDQGLRIFLHGLAVKQPASGHSLVLLTSRLAVYDLRKWQKTTAPLIDLTRLSDEAGAVLLEDGGVSGSPEALCKAAHDFAGHALALSLLAGYLRLLHGGDVSQRGWIREATNDPNDPGHDQARRIIEAYDEEWLAIEPVLLAIMYLVGLFDRPASADCMTALRSKPVVDGLTNVVIDLSNEAWGAAIARLREVRLLDPEDPSAPDALDTHPLVREWFGDRLKQENESAWKAAHGRLYEHLRDTTKEGKTPTLEDLAPLYQAIAHGCRAGRHQEVIAKIYQDRICKRDSSGQMVFYSGNQLGALGTDLAALSWFFDQPYETPNVELNAGDRGWLVATAAYVLRALGQFAQVLPAMRAALRMAEERNHWANAGIGASNLSETELLVGEIAAAVASARQSVTYADLTEEKFDMMSVRTTQADVLNAAGQRDKAERLFIDAERLQREGQPQYPMLYGIAGYRYCDLLLDQGEYSTASERAEKILEWEIETDPLLDRAMVRLELGRAYLGRALQLAAQGTARVSHDCSAIARTRISQATDGLRSAAQTPYIARGLLARATFRRSIGDWDGAARDLDEVEEIAELGPMKLFLCDMALERARLMFAMIEAFAPLNEFIDGSPRKPVVPGAIEAENFKNEASKNLVDARKLVIDCGYHRRNEELAELEAVLHSQRKFADLSPRV